MNWLPILAVASAIYAGWLIYRLGERGLGRHVDEALRLANDKQRHPASRPNVADEAEQFLKDRDV